MVFVHLEPRRTYGGPETIHNRGEKAQRVTAYSRFDQGGRREHKDGPVASERLTEIIRPCQQTVHPCDVGFFQKIRDVRIDLLRDIRQGLRIDSSRAEALPGIQPVQRIRKGVDSLHHEVGITGIGKEDIDSFRTGNTLVYRHFLPFLRTHWKKIADIFAETDCQQHGKQDGGKQDERSAAYLPVTGKEIV